MLHEYWHLLWHLSNAPAAAECKEGRNSTQLGRQDCWKWSEKEKGERCKTKYLNYKSYFITHIFLRVRFTHPWWTITCTLYHTYQQSWTSSSATHSKGTSQAKCSTCPSHFVYFDCFLISSVCIITYSCLAGIYYIILKMSWVTSVRVA